MASTTPDPGKFPEAKKFAQLSYIDYSEPADSK